MKKLLLILLLLVMVPALLVTYDRSASAQVLPSVPVIMNMTILPSLLLPPAATVVYTVPAGKSFDFSTVAFFNNTAPGGIPIDLNNVTLQIVKTVAGVRAVTPIFTTVIRADAMFSLFLGLTMAAGDTVEVVNGSGVAGGPVGVLVIGKTY
jgi:hypothetical protein